MDNVEFLMNGLLIREEDKQCILQLAADLDRTWNKRDARAFADLFETIGDFRFHTGAWIRGKISIENFWSSQVFPRLPAGMRHMVTPKQIRFITENVAIGDGTLRITDAVEGHDRVHLETEGTLVAVKRNARWYISSIRLAIMAPE